MAFQNDKGELFESMGVFKVMSGLPTNKKFNSMESISSKSKNLMPFLLDLLNSSCLDNAKTAKDKARCEVARILIEILIEFLPVLIKIVKEGVVKGIKAGLACGTDFTIPNPTPELTTEINRLDLNDMMKMDPNGSAGLLFGDPNKDFNRFLLDIITDGSNGNPSSQTWVDRDGNGLIQVTHNQPTPSTNNQPTITLKVADGVVNSDGFNRGDTSFHDFLVSYINSVELFSIKNVMATIMEMSFGSISLENNIGVDTLISQAKMDSSIEKILDVDVCADKLVLDNSFFDFGNEELLEFEREANNKSRGVSVMDLGCGLTEVAIPISILSDLQNLDNAPPTLVKDILEKTFESTGTAISQSGSEEDGPTMKANFNLKATLNFPKILMRMVITPKIVSLYQISHQTINDIVLDVRDGYDFSKAAKTFFEFVLREAAGALLEIVFNKIKKELIALISKVIAKIIKEKVKLYLGSIAGIYLSNAVTGAIESIEIPDTSNFV
jgi:hypothetical protein